MDGVILVNKPTGITSHDVVNGMRRALKTKAVGHAGTLDPLASGLLLCLVGEGTKLSNYVMSSDKKYRVKVKFGIVTDSGDITGAPIKESPVDLNPEEIRRAGLELKGPLELSVPKVSAIKIDGKKLYEYAREGKEVELPTRLMNIHNVDCIEVTSSTGTFDISCSKGTYIRSWAEKLGEIIGVGGTVETLVRLQSGDFKLEAALDFDACLNNPSLAVQGIVALEEVLKDWPALKVKGRDEKFFRNGQIPNGVNHYLTALNMSGGVRILAESGGLLALLNRENMDSEFKISRVFKPL